MRIVRHARDRSRQPAFGDNKRLGRAAAAVRSFVINHCAVRSVAVATSNTVAALCLMGLPMMLQSIYYGPIFAAVQSLVRPRTRATATAIFLLFANLIGLGLGPLSVGLLSDFLARSLGSGDAIRWALISTSLVYVLAAAAFMAARKTIRQDIVS